MLTPCGSRDCLEHARLRLKEAEASRLSSSCKSFREIRSIVDLAFNSSIDRARICELAACHFIPQRRDALLLDPSWMEGEKSLSPKL
jgi:hypothetical protein